ncbi:MAG: response regulator transcription factor [Chloroflexota bacterium]
MSKTILIVDDEPEMVEFLDSFLSLKGYQTLTAPTGAGCLRIAREKKPDLILLDLTLPDMDGLSVLEKLREEGRSLDIPVVVVSGKDHPQIRHDSLQAGADSFLLKPYDPQVLLDKIHSHLQK